MNEIRQKVHKLHSRRYSAGIFILHCFLKIFSAIAGRAKYQLWIYVFWTFHSPQLCSDLQEQVVEKQNCYKVSFSYFPDWPASPTSSSSLWPLQEAGGEAGKAEEESWHPLQLGHVWRHVWGAHQYSGFPTNVSVSWGAWLFKPDVLCRHEICKKMNTTGPKIYTLKTHKLRLYLLTVAQLKFQ